MDQEQTRQLLQAVADGTASGEEAIEQLKMEPFQDLGFAKVDHHRALRQGAAEVIYGAGKTPGQIIDITAALLSHGQKTVLITRLGPEAAAEVGAVHPLTYHEMGHIGIVGPMPAPTAVTMPRQRSRMGVSRSRFPAPRFWLVKFSEVWYTAFIDV